MIGMSIVSAQTTPTFSYQSVVFDENGDLVVDATVNAIVTIAYSGGIYTETHNNVTTSSNGMVILPIGGGFGTGDFSQIDWKTAQISVAYSSPWILSMNTEARYSTGLIQTWSTNMAEPQRKYFTM